MAAQIAFLVSLGKENNISTRILLPCYILNDLELGVVKLFMFLLCFQVYGLSWLVIVAVMVVLKVRFKLHANIQNGNGMPVIGSKH